MKYTNDKIKQLIAERDSVIEKYNRKIQFEIDLEKRKYKFSWKRFLMVVATCLMPLYVYINVKIFPDKSIWSWNHYINSGFKH